MRLAHAMLFGIALLLPHAGHAQQRTLDKAAQILEQQARRGKGEFISFLMGAASAYRWDSTEQGADGRHFCPPLRHALEGKTYARIALDEYRRARGEYAALGEYPLDVLALALQRGLRARFPCGDRTARPQSGTHKVDAAATAE